MFTEASNPNLHLYISTKTKISLPSLGFSIRKIGGGWKDKIVFVKTLLKKDFLVLGLVIMLSVMVIADKGSANYHDSAGVVFENKIKKYIEASHISALLLNRVQSAETSNESSFISLDGHSFKGNPINTIQQAALLAFNSLENDLSSFKGDDYQGNQIATYTVQEGDTLSFIASDFGVSVSTIIWANNLKNIHSISPGDELKIPPIDGVIHKIKKGDSIGSIAKKYGAEEEKIIAFNALPKDGAIQIDAEIIIPGGKIATPSSSSATSAIAKRFAYLPDMSAFFMLPATGRNWGRIHGRNGVDVANSCGTPIYAAADGTAATADAVGWNGGFGKFIKLVHPNGTETIYAHASKLLIGAGETIQKGQQIALMGTTGRSTGCHLHFEVHGAKNPLAKY
ncbi:MAG: peptidase M23 family protein [Parcubacteria group bacterium Gr01-1014_44]|nr:MAG: peptidase M23 family protein [Parcubacteria group bacterium Gr01-1014_44]